MAVKTYKFKYQSDFNSETDYPKENFIPYEAVKARIYEYPGYFSITKRVYTIKKDEFDKYPKFYMRNSGMQPCVMVVPNIDKDFKKSSFNDMPWSGFPSKDFVICAVSTPDEYSREWENFSKHGFNSFYHNGDVRDYVILTPISNTTKAAQKIFTSIEDIENAINTSKQKSKSEKLKIQGQKAVTNNGPMYCETPTYEIVEVNKKTDHIKGADVGDKIKGSITIISENGKSYIDKYSTYVSIYLNGEFVNSVPLRVFAKIMEFNFKLQQV